MKKVLLVIYNSFSEFEITVATAMLRSSYQVVTISDTYEKVTGESGLQFVPHLTYKDVDPAEYEAIIIPGGDLFNIKDTEELYELTKTFHDMNKLLASICSGTYVLARAGVLQGNPYTVTLQKEQRKFLGCFEEECFHYEPVVKWDKVITAQGHAYVDFGLAIAEHLDAISNKEFIREFYNGTRNRLMEDAMTQA
ncbi:DJ-1/PfpI family protein [Fredinandcohnia humi]